MAQHKEGWKIFVRRGLTQLNFYKNTKHGVNETFLGALCSLNDLQNQKPKERKKIC